MIIVRYHSEFGNRISQYCLGRILAKTLKTPLFAKHLAGFPYARSAACGLRQITHFSKKSITGHNHSIESLLELGQKQHLVLRGYFQRAEYFSPFIDEIKNDWLKQESESEVNSYDLTIHIRGGNRVGGRERIIHPDYPMLPVSFFRSIILEGGYNKIAIVTSDIHDSVVRALQEEFEADTFSRTPIEDFLFLRKSRNIVLSVSTYSWWAGFLSEASAIYYPKAGIFDPELMSLRTPVNEPNFLNSTDKHFTVRNVKTQYPWRGDRRQIDALLD